MSRNRQDRIKDFDQFYNYANELFKELYENDPRSDKFKVHSFYVSPGSRAGTNDPRVVDIFFGKRPFESLKSGGTWAALVEEGATLLLTRDDSGFIHVILYPACTERQRPIEDFITLYRRLDPQRLNDSNFIRSLWYDLIAYMECTSLDGQPNFCHRFRIKYLRIFRHLTVKEVFQPTKASVFGMDVLKWVFTVGLSGLLVFFVTKYSPSPDVQTEQLKQVNKNLEEISKQVNKLSPDNRKSSSQPYLKDSIISNGKSAGTK